MKIEYRGNEIVAIFTQAEGTIVPDKRGFVLVKTVDGNNPIQGEFITIPIATHGFQLEGVPMIVKGDVERLATTAVINKIGKYGLEHSTGMLLKSMFIEGYNLHSQTHEYTRADVERAIEMGRIKDSDYLPDSDRIQHFDKYRTDQILQSLQVPERLELTAELTTNYTAYFHAPNKYVPEYKLKHENGIIYLTIK